MYTWSAMYNSSLLLFHLKYPQLIFAFYTSWDFKHLPNAEHWKSCKKIRSLFRTFRLINVIGYVEDWTNGGISICTGRVISWWLYFRSVISLSGDVLKKWEELYQAKNYEFVWSLGNGRYSSQRCCCNQVTCNMKVCSVMTASCWIHSQISYTSDKKSMSSSTQKQYSDTLLDCFY